MKKFAQLLGQYVENTGMKQTHVAATAHISYNYLQRLLSGDRNPSNQVVYKLAQALHLSMEQTGELLASAGYAPPLALMQSSADKQQSQQAFTTSLEDDQRISRLTQQFYRLVQDIPDALQTSFIEEMQHLFGYARYKYILSGGIPILDLDITSSQIAFFNESSYPMPGSSSSLDVIAQIVGELHKEPEEANHLSSDGAPLSSQVLEDMLSTIDQLTGKILVGDVSNDRYQRHIIVQTLGILREGAPWEIRRRIAEALPGFFRLAPDDTQHMMETLRLDTDDIRGVDIRRRVVEALPILFDATPETFPLVQQLLYPKDGDDVYVALATAEVCGDLQEKVKQLLEPKRPPLNTHESSRSEALRSLLQQAQVEIARIQRQLLVNWEEKEREGLQFSMTLHNLLCAPDTLLLSVREGLQSPEKLIQLVAARYLEHLLPMRPEETLTLYQLLLHTATKRNVRRTVAKALPALLECLKEASLPIRAQARKVIVDLAIDSDVYIRRAVADHAMQIFHIDREFLFVLLRSMQKDTDHAIRHRLQPVALRLAQVWLTWYAETAGLVETAHGRKKAILPFGE